MKIINGKWQVGNLYDALVSEKFDRFINLHRQHSREVKRAVNLKQHNYIYQWKQS